VRPLSPPRQKQAEQNVPRHFLQNSSNLRL
jgi:hypothetical protein